MLTSRTAELDARHQAALSLADAMMTQPSDLSDDLVGQLHRWFSVEQLIELTLDVMKWNEQKISVALGTDAWVHPGELSDLAFDEHGDVVR